MIPINLPGESLEFPATRSPTLVIFTMEGLQHRRFAYRLQQEFGNETIAWYEVRPTTLGSHSNTATRRHGSGGAGVFEKIAGSARRVKSGIVRHGIKQSVGKGIQQLIRKPGEIVASRREDHRRFLAEQNMIGKEVDDLAKFSQIEPEKITAEDLVSDKFCDEIRKLDPYLILCTDDISIPHRLTNIVRAAVVRQAAGQLSELQGRNVISLTLYRRRLDLVTASVLVSLPGSSQTEHLARQSIPCFSPRDDQYMIAARVQILGTELLIESVRQILKEKTLYVCTPTEPCDEHQFNPQDQEFIRQSIKRDIDAGWLIAELNCSRQF